MLVKPLSDDADSFLGAPCLSVEPTGLFLSDAPLAEELSFPERTIFGLYLDFNVERFDAPH